jgi:predicted aconitase
LDFAERLVELGGTVVVPTTLNVGTLDLLHPELFQGDEETARKGRRLMEAYVSLGCEPTWTCAPYQLPTRPALGEHIAWAESNAIVFANSVLGARTNRYGDFIDICAALSGRVPEAGLHRTEERRGQIVFRPRGLPARLLDEDVFYPVLGHLVGQEAGTLVPVLDGLPPSVNEDRMKALGAAAASSGSVALVHVVGVTPEAGSLDQALQGQPPQRTIDVTPEAIRAARDSLTTSGEGPLVAVCLGTPHFSQEEFRHLVSLLDDFALHPSVDFYVTTSRHVLNGVEERGWLPILAEAGIELIVDTCTYVTPILRRRDGLVMTNSAKWAYYAPGNLGVEVAFGSLEECVGSAQKGEVWRDPALWSL